MWWFGRNNNKKKKEKQSIHATPKKRLKKKKDTWFSNFIITLKNVGTGTERELTIENLAMLIESGMDVLTALSSIEGEVRTKRMKEVITSVRGDVEDGSPLWKAFDEQRILDGYILALIRIGEEAGRLPQNLRVIVVQQQKERLFRSKLRSAMAYPVLVLSIAFMLGLGLSVFILPRLENVFGSLRLDLPLFTKILLAFGRFMGDYGVYVAPASIMGFVLVIFFVFIFKKTRWIGQWMLFSIPGVRRLIREVELARMGYVLGTLLKAGLPIVDAIASLTDATAFYKYGQLYKHLSSQVKVGESLQTAFKGFKKIDRYIPRPIQQMVVAGEQSGRLPEAFLKIGEIYEAKTETTAKNLATILEPLLLLVVWVGVAGVALAVIMPIYGLLGGIGEGQRSVDSSQTEPPPVAVASPSPSPLPVSIEISLPEEAVAVRLLQATELRGEPSLTAEILTVVAFGLELPIDDTEEDEPGEVGWYKVVVAIENEESDVEGWVVASAVQPLLSDGSVVNPSPTPVIDEEQE